VIALPPSFDVTLALDIALLAMLLVMAGAIVRTRSLLAAIILFSIYSLVSAVWLVVMDAADVAFTEAVVGAGVSTIVLLGAILLTRGEAEKPDWRRLIAPALVCASVGGLLIYATTGLPALGDPASPANAHVGRTYLEAAPRDIGVPNIVTAVLSSYRGFDTWGETAVIFAAGIGVALMLGFGPRASLLPPPAAIGEHHVVLRVSAKFLIPLIALFALYVQFHGDLGAGGGFQAGVIMAAAIILHALVFGLRAAMAAVSPRLVRSIASLGVLFYAGVGIACMLNGGAFLDYDYLFPPAVEKQIPGWLLGDSDHAHHWGQHFGILLIELGVLLTVAATMITIFYGFAGRTVETIRQEGRP
jgi:multicomponent Na+:H+ antiporter subunit B